MNKNSIDMVKLSLWMLLNYIFCPKDRNEVNGDYATKQIVSIIRKHQNSFLPTQGTFTTKSNNRNE